MEESENFVVLDDGTPVGDIVLQTALVDLSTALLRPILDVIRALVAKGVLTPDDLRVYLDEPEGGHPERGMTISDMITGSVHALLNEIQQLGGVTSGTAGGT